MQSYPNGCKEKMSGMINVASQNEKGVRWLVRYWGKKLPKPNTTL